MKLDGGRISPGQLIFMVTSFTLGPALVKSLAVGAGKASWLVILLGLGQSLIIAFMFTSLSIKFPGKTLVEFNDIIYGPLLGKIISLGYLFYFFLLATLPLRQFGDFFAGLVFPQTPMVVFISLITLVSASAVRNGIEVIARLSQVLLPITILTIGLTLGLSIPNMDLNRLLPLFDLSLKDFLKSGYTLTVFPFGQAVAFLMIIAFVGPDQAKVKKARLALMLGLIGGGLLLLVTDMRSLSVLGNTSAITQYDSYQAVSLIKVGDIFNRLEIVVFTNFIAMLFLVVTMLYYNAALGMAQILKLRTYLPLVLPIGILLICTSIIQFGNIPEYLRFSDDIGPYFAFPFQIGIPLISLIICEIKGRAK